MITPGQPDISMNPFCRHMPITGTVTEQCSVASGPGGITYRTSHVVLGHDGIGNEIALDFSGDPAYLYDLIHHLQRCADWQSGWAA